MTTRENMTRQHMPLAILPQVFTADGNGLDIDTRGFDSATMVVAVGNSGDVLSGSVFIELELEEADDDGAGSPSTYTDVANADLVADPAIGVGDTPTNAGAFAFIDAPAEDSTVFKASYRGVKQWIRAVVNLTGTHTNGTPIAAVCVLGHRHVSGPPAAV